MVKGVRGRPKGSKNAQSIKRELLARAGVVASQKTGRAPLHVVLDVMDGVGRDGKPLDQGGKAYEPQQIDAAIAALPYTTPKLIAVKMQVSEPPDPKLEALRHMTLEERRQFRELLAAAEARRMRPVIDATAVEVVIEDDEEGDE